MEERNFRLEEMMCVDSLGVEMIAEYRVASWSSHEEDLDGCDGMQKRVDEFALVREAHKMPYALATLSVQRQSVDSLFDARDDLARTVRRITVRADVGTELHKAEARLEYLTAVCPYCGHKSRLEHDNWRVYVEMPSGAARVASEAVDCDCGQTDCAFADYPDEWMPFSSGTLKPLAACSEPLAKPYGDSIPLDDLLAEAQQLMLPLFDSDGPMAKKTFGQAERYKGIYECQHCGGAYYAIYNGLNLGEEAFMSKYLVTYPYDLPHLGPEGIKATVTATNGIIEIEFSPAVQNRVTTIRFDTKRGYTEVDDCQLMKRDELAEWDLDRLPLDFLCPQLLSHIAGLMEAYIDEARRAYMLVGVSRGRTASDFGFSSELNFADLAVVNRLQGYPDELYRNIFLQRAYVDVYNDLAPFDALPVHYKDIAAAYDSSGLPQCKSIRRLAFRQPLFISYVQTLDRVPFKDPNLLREFFSCSCAFEVLEELRLSQREVKELRCELNVFDYLKETRGELKTWRYLRSLINANASLRYLMACGLKRYLTEDIRAVVDGLKIDCAARVLGDVFRYERCGHSVHEEYVYTQAELQLEGSVAGYEFKLPHTPLSLAIAGAGLHNCLGDYMSRIHRGSTVLIISRCGKLEGAIEVQIDRRSVVQIEGRFGARLSDVPSLRDACTAWMREEELFPDKHSSRL